MTYRTCRWLLLWSVANRRTHLVGEAFLSTTCQKTRFARLGMPAGMHAGAASPPAGDQLFPGLTVKLPGESSLQHWPTGLVGSR
jgi:hypothetical protein